ncbi:Sulfotransferase family cytosolic 1B member 1 [Armadillidium vulgare]|nr:Sulfotransferase family cytosolic 1B member 1 [Armadillidium vulgare]
MFCRDPRDVCVSYYYHSIKFDGFTGNFDQFFELFINDLAFFSPFWKHVLDFWEKRDEDNVLFIRFEELKKDLRGNIEKVAKFLGRRLE